MIKVLYVEDRQAIRSDLSDRLQEKGFDILACKSIYEAGAFWDAKKDYISSIILDLMLSPIGLPEKLHNRTRDGSLTGWIWLWHCLNPSGSLPHPAQDKNIVIYSGYIDELTSYLSSSNATEDERSFFSKYVTPIPKDNPFAEDELVKILLSGCHDLYDDASSE